MVSSSNGPVRAKTLLAIAFAGNILTSQLPASGQEFPAGSSPTSSSARTSSFISGIEKSAHVTAEARAFYLLQLASSYCTGGDTTGMEIQIEYNLKKSDNGSLFQTVRKGEPFLGSWASSVALLGCSTGANRETKASETKMSVEHRAIADRAISAAIEQLGLDVQMPKALNLNMYLIASGLSRVTGNTLNEQKCTKVLSQAIQACESSKVVDSAQIKAIASILNTMAYGLVPIKISDYQPQSPLRTPEFDIKDLAECERLKLKAAALLDKLPAGDQDRRKAHRDLTLWYQQLGKVDKALKEKQELFNLVGIEDDRILYPQAGGCGHVVWWTVQTARTEIDCGMG